MRKIFVTVALLCFFACQEQKSTWTKTTLIQIKVDDEANYHFTIQKENGEIQSYADKDARIFKGNYRPSVYFEYNPEKSFPEILIYLPNNYNIELFND